MKMTEKSSSSARFSDSFLHHGEETIGSILLLSPSSKSGECSSVGAKFLGVTSTTPTTGRSPRKKGNNNYKALHTEEDDYQQQQPVEQVRSANEILLAMVDQQMQPKAAELIKKEILETGDDSQQINSVSEADWLAENEDDEDWIVQPLVCDDERVGEDKEEEHTSTNSHNITALVGGVDTFEEVESTINAKIGQQNEIQEEKDGKDGTTIGEEPKQIAETDRRIGEIVDKVARNESNPDLQRIASKFEMPAIFKKQLAAIAAKPPISFVKKLAAPSPLTGPRSRGLSRIPVWVVQQPPLPPPPNRHAIANGNHPNTSLIASSSSASINESLVQQSPALAAALAASPKKPTKDKAEVQLIALRLTDSLVRLRKFMLCGQSICVLVKNWDDPNVDEIFWDKHLTNAALTVLESGFRKALARRVIVNAPAPQGMGADATNKAQENFAMLETCAKMGGSRKMESPSKRGRQPSAASNPHYQTSDLTVPTTSSIKMQREQPRLLFPLIYAIRADATRVNYFDKAYFCAICKMYIPITLVSIERHLEKKHCIYRTLTSERYIYVGESEKIPLELADYVHVTKADCPDEQLAHGTGLRKLEAEVENVLCAHDHQQQKRPPPSTPPIISPLHSSASALQTLAAAAAAQNAPIATSAIPSSAQLISAATLGEIGDSPSSALTAADALASPAASSVVATPPTPGYLFFVPAATSTPMVTARGQHHHHQQPLTLTPGCVPSIGGRIRPPSSITVPIKVSPPLPPTNFDADNIVPIPLSAGGREIHVLKSAGGSDDKTYSGGGSKKNVVNQKKSPMSAVQHVEVIVADPPHQSSKNRYLIPPRRIYPTKKTTGVTSTTQRKQQQQLANSTGGTKTTTQKQQYAASTGATLNSHRFQHHRSGTEFSPHQQPHHAHPQQYYKQQQQPAVRVLPASAEKKTSPQFVAAYSGAAKAPLIFPHPPDPVDYDRLLIADSNHFPVRPVSPDKGSTIRREQHCCDICFSTVGRTTQTPYLNLPSLFRHLSSHHHMYPVDSHRTFWLAPVGYGASLRTVADSVVVPLIPAGESFLPFLLNYLVHPYARPLPRGAVILSTSLVISSQQPKEEQQEEKAVIPIPVVLPMPATDAIVLSTTSDVSGNGRESLLEEKVVDAEDEKEEEDIEIVTVISPHIEVTPAKDFSHHFERPISTDSLAEAAADTQGTDNVVDESKISVDDVALPAAMHQSNCSDAEKTEGEEQREEFIVHESVDFTGEMIDHMHEDNGEVNEQNFSSISGETPVKNAVQEKSSIIATSPLVMEMATTSPTKKKDDHEPIAGETHLDPSSPINQKKEILISTTPSSSVEKKADATPSTNRSFLRSDQQKDTSETCEEEEGKAEESFVSPGPKKYAIRQNSIDFRAKIVSPKKMLCSNNFTTPSLSTVRKHNLRHSSLYRTPSDSIKKGFVTPRKTRNVAKRGLENADEKSKIVTDSKATKRRAGGASAQKSMKKGVVSKKLVSPANKPVSSKVASLKTSTNERKVSKRREEMEKKYVASIGGAKSVKKESEMVVRKQAAKNVDIKNTASRGRPKLALASESSPKIVTKKRKFGANDDVGAESAQKRSRHTPKLFSPLAEKQRKGKRGEEENAERVVPVWRKDGEKHKKPIKKVKEEPYDFPMVCVERNTAVENDEEETSASSKTKAAKKRKEEVQKPSTSSESSNAKVTKLAKDANVSEKSPAKPSSGKIKNRRSSLQILKDLASAIKFPKKSKPVTVASPTKSTKKMAEEKGGKKKAAKVQEKPRRQRKRKRSESDSKNEEEEADGGDEDRKTKRDETDESGVLYVLSPTKRKYRKTKK